MKKYSGENQLSATQNKPKKKPAQGNGGSTRESTNPTTVQRPRTKHLLEQIGGEGDDIGVWGETLGRGQVPDQACC